MELTAGQIYTMRAALQNLAQAPGLEIAMVYAIARKIQVIGMEAALVERARIASVMKHGTKSQDGKSTDISPDDVDATAAFNADMAPILLQAIAVPGDPIPLSALANVKTLTPGDMVVLMPLIVDDTAPAK